MGTMHRESFPGHEGGGHIPSENWAATSPVLRDALRSVNFFEFQDGRIKNGKNQAKDGLTAIP